MNLYTGKGQQVSRVLLLFAAFLALVLPRSAFAVTERQTLRQILDESEYVVVATCTGQSTHFEATGARIFTVSRFDVQQTIAGKGELQDLSIRVIGGDREGFDVHVPGAPRFETGKKYLLFVTKEFDNGFRTTVGWKQGVMEVLKPSAHEPEVVASPPGFLEVFDPELKIIRQEKKSHIAGLTLKEVVTILERETSKQSSPGKPAAAAAGKSAGGDAKP